nr:MAG: methionine ABC transporter ATP-binding protein [Bacillota bacterium]
MIRVENLTKVYTTPDGRQIRALDGVSLHVRRGEIFGVIGPSGAGKSSLIRCINLLERPTSGSIQVDGKEMTRLSGPELRRERRQIGMIFQHFNLFWSRTVAENVAFPLEIAGWPREKIRRRVAELLELVGLTDKARAYPAQLSGGQKQRVGIARALAAEPKVLLSDEATSALDPETTDQILALLRRINRELGLTILLITHQMEVVKAICDSVAVMSQGRVLEAGPVLELASRPGSHLGRMLLPSWNGLTPSPGSSLVALTFAGQVALEPVVTRVARDHGMDINILAGELDAFGSVPVGRLLVELPRVGEELQAVLADLSARGVRWEVVARG